MNEGRSPPSVPPTIRKQFFEEAKTFFGTRGFLYSLYIKTKSARNMIRVIQASAPVLKDHRDFGAATVFGDEKSVPRNCVRQIRQKIAGEVSPDKCPGLRCPHAALD